MTSFRSAAKAALKTLVWEPRSIHVAEVTLSRKGAKNRTHSRKPRSTGTKANARCSVAMNPTGSGQEAQGAC